MIILILISFFDSLLWLQYNNKQPQPKGKQGTKGSKQIVEENVATLKFYRNMAGAGTGLYLVVMVLLFPFSWFSIVSIIQI